MECEICGKERYTRPVEKEGATLYLCSDCGGYARPNFTKPGFKPRFGGNRDFRPYQGGQGGFRRFDNKPNFNRPERKPEVQMELVENYGPLIAQARQKINLKTEELARELFMGASYLNKIEAGKFKPDYTATKKLEKRLNITLYAKPKQAEGVKVEPKVENLESQTKPTPKETGNTLTSAN
jgi:putative transcription factor